MAEDIEKFIREGGAKVDVRKAKDKQAVPSKPVRKEKEIAARMGVYDEQRVSEWKAVSNV